MSAPKLKNSQQAVSVKHINPYPIEVQFQKTTAPGGAGKGQIVKMVEVGFLMKTEVGPLFKIADESLVKFELPVIHVIVETPTRVVKTYDGYEFQGKKQIKVYTIEMHFRSLDPKYREAIEEYLVQSGQKKRA